MRSVPDFFPGVSGPPTQRQASQFEPTGGKNVKAPADFEQTFTREPVIRSDKSLGSRESRLDEHFGAVHHRMLFIEYQPGVSIALHDHTFEEAYFILSGEVEGTLGGKTYRAGPGDVLWTGVGCVHTFVNRSTGPVRWLETFAPQPPRENVFRFMAEWDQKARSLEQAEAL